MQTVAIGKRFEAWRGPTGVPSAPCRSITGFNNRRRRAGRVSPPIGPALVAAGPLCIYANLRPQDFQKPRGFIAPNSERAQQRSQGLADASANPWYATTIYRTLKVFCRTSIPDQALHNAFSVAGFN